MRLSKKYQQAVLAAAAGADWPGGGLLRELLNKAAIFIFGGISEKWQIDRIV